MGYKVLLVEDNNDCRELLAALLDQLGYHVLQAENGAVAIQKAVNEKPDLILMDLRMPNMDGIQATSCLRESEVTKDTPIIICSAWVPRQHRDSALKSGAREVVTKPVSIKQIESLISRYLPVSTDEMKMH
jgi:twitching motility two-component system response regulator PilH